MKSKRRKELEGRLGEFGLRRLQASLMSKTPIAAEQQGAKLGRLLMKFGKRRRERALANLELAFPEWPAEERGRVMKATFEHFGMITADFLQIPKRTMEEFYASTEVVGAEHLASAIAEGKGVLLITGHFGNWERTSTWVSAQGYGLNVVARDADDTGVNAIVNELRTKTGTKVLSRGTAARPILEALRRNEIVGILPDQNSDEIFIPFFGKPAGTVLGPGVIHKRTGAAVIPSYGIRIGPGKYRVEIHPPLLPLEGYDPKEGLMRAIHGSLEEMIRRYPEQYLWFHDRWRNARKQGLL